MGREVRGGMGMGKTCEPKAFSFQCMTKFTTSLNSILGVIEKGNLLLDSCVEYCDLMKTKQDPIRSSQNRPTHVLCLPFAVEKL